MILKKYLIKPAALVLLGLGLFGCAAGTFVKPDGTTDKPVWPGVKRATLDHKKGTFPNMTNLQQVKAGMTKDQMYALLGRPHFSELWGVREWNFLFHFHTPNMGENNVSTCQYKILYDEHGITRSFYWQPVLPENGDCPPRIKKLEKHTVSADALFDFDGSTLVDMNSSGRRELNEISKKIIKNQDIESIKVYGYTDHLGDDAYNLRLSERRAQTVRDYLVDRGVDAHLIHAKGMGEKEPVKNCADVKDRAALIACLHPNRRVEVTVHSSVLPDQ